MLTADDSAGRLDRTRLVLDRLDPDLAVEIARGLALDHRNSRRNVKNITLDFEQFFALIESSMHRTGLGEFVKLREYLASRSQCGDREVDSSTLRSCAHQPELNAVSRDIMHAKGRAS